MKVQWCHALGAQNFLMEGQEHQLVHKQQEQYCLFTDAAAAAALAADDNKPNVS